MKLMYRKSNQVKVHHSTASEFFYTLEHVMFLPNESLFHKLSFHVHIILNGKLRTIVGFDLHIHNTV